MYVDEDTVNAYDLTDLHWRYSHERWDFSWGHASASVGGRCWVPMLHTFPTFVSPIFPHDYNQWDYLFLFFLPFYLNLCCFSLFSLLCHHQLLWYIMPFLWIIEDECLEKIYGLCVVFPDIIFSTKDPEHEAYRSS